MDIKAILSNGAKERTLYKSTKGINPWDPDDHPEAWTGQVRPDAVALVPAVQSSIQARCKAMSDLPFCVYKGDNEIDNSDDYQNKMGFMPNPRLFLWLTEAALICYGKAYWLKQSNKYNYVKGAQYFLPTSIKAIIEKIGLVGFERTNGPSIELYKPEEIVYLWLPDPSVEIGPPAVYPLAAALVSANALDRINVFVKDYMERGAVKAMLLAAKQMPTKEEAERVETWFNKFMRGAKSLTWKVFNADAITPTIVGEGLEAFKGIQILDDLTRQVHTAMGTRHLLEDENYATANVRQREFYSNTIMPDARLISDVLNTQVLSVLDYRIEFEPDRLEVFKQDEADNATALGTLTSAIADSPADVVELAMSILGYDLTEDEQELLDAIKLRKETDKPDVTPVEIKPEEDVAPLTEEDLSAPDMAKWLRKACKHIGRDVLFVSDTIPAGMQSAIHAGLPACACEADVRSLFGKSETVSETIAPAYEAPSYSGILEAMRLEMQAIKHVPSGQTGQSVTIVDTSGKAVEANMMEYQKASQSVVDAVNAMSDKFASIPAPIVNVPAAIVNVTVPEPPAPVITFTKNEPDETRDVVKVIRKLANGKK